MNFAKSSLAFTVAVLVTMAAYGIPQQKPYTNDLNENYKAPAVGRDYTRREVMIPMRDGVKLFMIMCIPKGAHNPRRLSAEHL